MATNAASVDWSAYFYGIRSECPWSWAAWQKGQISIDSWQGQAVELAPYLARVYLVDMTTQQLLDLTESLDSADTACEWLYSYPEYGESATPVPVLIQQNRAQLNRLRSQLDPEFSEQNTTSTK